MFERPKTLEQILRERFVDYENRIKKLPVNEQINLQPFVKCLDTHFALYKPARYFAIREDLDSLHKKLFPKEVTEACTHNKEIEENAPTNLRRRI